MTRNLAKAQSTEAQRRRARLTAAAAAALAALLALPEPAAAAKRHGRHGERTAETAAPRAAGAPIMAIVSIKSQRVTIYDADGWILRAPVSTGTRGRETPAGVFSVIQKEKDHYSNLYDDAYMPHMHRITWSGIALHGGPLPGHPASHGCIRLPYGFAGRLFEISSVGMRVIIAPEAAPVEIAHPALFSPKPDAGARATALAAEANEAGRKADAARTAAAAAAREAARARMPLRTLENQKGRAEGELARAEAALEAASSDEAKAKATDAKTKAEAKVADLKTQWDAAMADLQPKLDAAASTKDAAAAAESARAAAAKAARDAARDLEPVSIFISRKAQRLYVRRGFEPVLDVPVTIRDPDRPIGTHVFTAVARTASGLRWTVVELNHASDAKSALDRIVIPQEVLDRFAPTAAPRSSLIISDEPLSRETGKGTEFVAVLSEEPQGGLAMRKRSTPTGFRFVRQPDRQFWGSSRSSGSWGSWGSPYGTPTYRW
jgi:chemotaxis protein histidine kinase CheA